MKKFLSGTAAVAAAALVIILVLNSVYMKMEISDSDNTAKYKNVPDNIQVCNFGSSHGQYAFCYDDYADKMNCFNFSLTAQSLSYDDRILQNYKDKISEGAVVFISLSYFSFFGTPEEQEDGFDSKNKRYYKFLKKEYIKDFDFETWVLEDKLPILGAYENVFTVFAGRSKNENDALWNRVIQPEELEQDVKDAYKRHIVLYRYDENGNRIVNQENVEALYSIIYTCEEIGAQPILVTVPYMREYTDYIKKMSPDFYDDFYGIIDKVVDDTGIKYYDYAFDDRFSDDYTLYMNCDHLNKTGAKKFVDILMKEFVED